MTPSTFHDLPDGRAAGAQEGVERALRPWLAAVGIAAAATWLLYAAAPGINWLLATLLAVAGLAAVTHRDGGRPMSGLRVPLVLATLLAGAAAVTDNGAFQFWIAVGTLTLFAVATLVAAGLPASWLGPLALASAPFRAPFLLVAEASRRCSSGARDLVHDEGNFRLLRGGAFALPVVAVFFLLLAGADPILNAWRDAIARTIRDLSFVPRLALFLVLATALLGLYGLALRTTPAARQMTRPAVRGRFADVERVIVLGAVAALFALFLGLQVSYLFGNPGARAGSGITFAEAVHRGFDELSVVVTLCSWLIVACDRYAIAGSRERVVRWLGFALLAECAMLLASAYHRLFAYQAVYGYTTARLYVAIYVGAAAVGVALLAREVWQGIDLSRLTRGLMVTAVIAACVPMYWNSAAFVVRQNVARYVVTGRIDANYLGYGLSADAIPDIVRALPRLPADAAHTIRSGLAVDDRRPRCDTAEERRWFEWNVRRNAACEALASLPAATAPPTIRPGATP